MIYFKIYFHQVQGAFRDTLPDDDLLLLTLEQDNWFEKNHQWKTKLKTFWKRLYQILLTLHIAVKLQDTES